MGIKKAEIAWEAIVKIILALVVLVFIIGLIWMSRDKILNFINTIFDVLRVS